MTKPKTISELATYFTVRHFFTDLPTKLNLKKLTALMDAEINRKEPETYTQPIADFMGDSNIAHMYTDYSNLTLAWEIKGLFNEFIEHSLLTLEFHNV